MKNTELHKFIKAFDIETPETPLHQASLKNALLRVAPTQQSAISQFFGSFINTKGEFVKKNKVVASVGFATLTMVMASVLIFTQYTHNPKARAEELTDKGILTLRQLDVAEFERIRGQFAGDPVEALQEAKTAKDLKTIDKDEYGQLKKDSRVVVTTNKTEQLPGGGSMSSGSVITKNSAGEPTEMGSVSVTSGAIDPSAVPVSGTEVGQAQIVEAQLVSDESLPTITNADGTTPVALTAVGSSNETAATKYVKYTNSEGNAVVIGFDNTDTPVFKTVFQK